MKFNKNLISSIVLIHILILCGCGKNNGKLILAASSCGTITAADFFDEYDGYSEEQKSRIVVYDDYYKIVRKLALKQIMYRHAVDGGLLSEPDVIDMLAEAKQNIGYDILFRKNVTDKIRITESDYAAYRKVYDLYQIVRRTDTLDEARIARSRTIMADLAKNVKTFDAFKQAAVKFSEDVTASDGGYMGQIRRGILDEELDKELAHMSEDTMSGIIETNSGLHILWLDKITNRPTDSLISDQSIYDDIYSQKKSELTAQWYAGLLKDKQLVINMAALAKNAPGGGEVIRYNQEIFTKDDIDAHIAQLRQNGAFPEPTAEETQHLVENIALNLVISAKVLSPEVTDTAAFHKSYDNRCRIIVENAYIARHVKTAAPTEDEILRFYAENRQTLFSFHNGQRDFVQPLSDVRDFIVERLTESQSKNAKYDLYRAEIASADFRVFEKNIESIMKK